MKDEPNFFGNERSYSSYLSFNKVFTFNTTDITFLFTQPVVPTDLLSSVSINDSQPESHPAPDPIDKGGYGKIQSNPRSKSRLKK